MPETPRPGQKAPPSALVEVECLLTLDRLRLRMNVDAREIDLRWETVIRLLVGMDVVQPTGPVLSQASQPIPVPLGTLDAIHLATALLWKDRVGAELVMATHDAVLAVAARSCGFRVAGAQKKTPGRTSPPGAVGSIGSGASLRLWLNSC